MLAITFSTQMLKNIDDSNKNNISLAILISIVISVIDGEARI